MEPEIKTEEGNPSQKEQTNGTSHSPPEMNDCKEQQDTEVTESVPALQTKPDATTAKPVKKNQKSGKEQKKAKEEEKRLKLLLRTYQNIEDPTEKLEALGRKYLQLASDNRTVETKKDELEKQNEKLSKQADQLQSELNRMTMAKGKLESLCRELQRHSKLVKEECQLRTQEEETKRKELSDKFQTTINDISDQMQDNFKRNQELKEENAQLAQKLKNLVEQYEVREEHVEKIFKHKQLELQLAEAKMTQQGLTHNEDKEKALLEKQQLVKQSLEYQKKCEILTKTEAELRAQVSMYTEKFDEFQKTLNKSNEVFKTFKKEMDKMTKTIKKLEKENSAWKTRWENTNQSLIRMVAERTEKEKEMAAMKLKNEKLENLCRALQKARKEVTDKLEMAGLSTGPSKDPPDATTSLPVEDCTSPQQVQAACSSQAVAVKTNGEKNESSVQLKAENEEQPEKETEVESREVAESSDQDTQRESNTEGNREREVAVAEQLEQLPPQGVVQEECVNSEEQHHPECMEEVSGGGEVNETEETQSGNLFGDTSETQVKKENQPVQHSEDESA